MFSQPVVKPFNSIPISVMLLNNGCIGFIRHGDFADVIDVGQFPRAHISNKGISIESKKGDVLQYEYNTMIAYKQEPVLLEWLKAQQMSINL